jgi:hypothetical protein
MKVRLAWILAVALLAVGGARADGTPGCDMTAPYFLGQQYVSISAPNPTVTPTPSSTGNLNELTLFGDGFGPSGPNPGYGFASFGSLTGGTAITAIAQLDTLTNSNGSLMSESGWYVIAPSLNNHLQINLSIFQGSGSDHNYYVHFYSVDINGNDTIYGTQQVSGPFPYKLKIEWDGNSQWKGSVSFDGTNYLLLGTATIGSQYVPWELGLGIDSAANNLKLSNANYAWPTINGTPPLMPGFRNVGASGGSINAASGGTGFSNDGTFTDTDSAPQVTLTVNDPGRQLCSSTQIATLQEWAGNSTVQLEETISIYDSVNDPFVYSGYTEGPPGGGINGTYDFGNALAPGAPYTLAQNMDVRVFHHGNRSEMWKKLNIPENVYKAEIATTWAQVTGGAPRAWALGPFPNYWCNPQVPQFLAPDYQPRLYLGQIEPFYTIGDSLCISAQNISPGWHCSPGIGQPVYVQIPKSNLCTATFPVH